MELPAQILARLLSWSPTDKWLEMFAKWEACAVPQNMLPRRCMREEGAVYVSSSPRYDFLPRASPRRARAVVNCAVTGRTLYGGIHGLVAFATHYGLPLSARRRGWHTDPKTYVTTDADCDAYARWVPRAVQARQEGPRRDRRPWCAPRFVDATYHRHIPAPRYVIPAARTLAHPPYALPIAAAELHVRPHQLRHARCVRTLYLWCDDDAPRWYKLARVIVACVFVVRSPLLPHDDLRRWPCPRAHVHIVAHDEEVVCAHDRDARAATLLAGLLPPLLPAAT